MFDLVKFATKAALADRKGVTAMEYALIAALVTTVAIAAYRTMFGKLKTYIEGITFS